MSGGKSGKEFVAELEKCNASLYRSDGSFPKMDVQFWPLGFKKGGELTWGPKCGERLWLLRTTGSLY